MRSADLFALLLSSSGWAGVTGRWLILPRLFRWAGITGKSSSSSSEALSWKSRRRPFRRAALIPAGRTGDSSSGETDRSCWDSTVGGRDGCVVVNACVAGEVICLRIHGESGSPQ